MRDPLTLMAFAVALVIGAALAWAWRSHLGSRQRASERVHLESKRLLALQQETNRQLQESNSTLQLSEERLAVTLQSIGDALIATDVRGRITLLNPVAEKLTGWTQAQATGRSVNDVVQLVEHGSLRPITAPVAAALAQGRKQSLPSHTQMIARNGSACDIADSCAPILDRAGQVIGAVLVFRDVTKEDAAQRCLRDQQFYTRSMLECHVDALIMTDASGRISDLNHQTELLCGRRRAELIGSAFQDCCTDPQRAQAAIEGVLAQGKLRDCELTVRASDGRETLVSCNAATFHDREGELQGVFLAARDCTELRRVQQLLEQRTRELEQAMLRAREPT